MCGIGGIVAETEPAGSTKALPALVRVGLETGED
jgi:hypothetical protein